MNNENFANNEKIQNLILENRKKLSISGVLDVLSFDDQIVILDTNLGILTVKGEDIRINKLSIDTSDISIEGTINSLAYSARKEAKDAKTLMGKIFK